MTSARTVSVVVCTRNRRQAIPGCLDAIRASAAAAAPHPCQIVVVDSASTDGTAEEVGRWSARTGFSVEVARSSRAGLAIARNVGLDRATGELLVFTDDDCELEEGYIRHAIDTVSATAPAIHGGRVLLADDSDLPLTIKTDPTPRRQSKADRSARRSNLGDLLLGCNMVFDRAVVDRVGRFDERLGAGAEIPAGEDTDFFIRGYLAGVALVYDPELVVHHRHGRKSLEDGRSLFVGYTIGTGALYAKHALRDIDLLRPVYWDFKRLVADVIRRRNSFAPEVGFSYVDKFRHYGMGAARYLLGAPKRTTGGPEPRVESGPSRG